MSIRVGPKQYGGPFTVPAAPGVVAITPWFLTAGADFFQIAFWGGSLAPCDQCSLLFSPDGVTATPNQPTTTAYLINPAVNLIVLNATEANPSVLSWYPSPLGLRTAAWLDYFAFTMSATTTDTTGVMMWVQPHYIIDMVG